MKTVRTNSGDFWDLTACIAYGRHPGDDHLMHVVLEANLAYANLKQLSANIELNIPEPPARTPNPRIPWT
jgi:phage tail protein X